MKKAYILISILSIFFFGYGMSNIISVKSATPNNKVVYFHSEFCDGCRALKGLQSDNSVDESENYIKKIEDAGIEIIYMDVDKALVEADIPDNVIYELDKLPTVGDLWDSFSIFYDVPEDKQHTPSMFVGETHYSGDVEIKAAFDSGELQTNAELDFLEVNVEAGQNYQSTKGFLGFLGVLGAGLLDGFNPCAIALLLMFISLLGFTENKRILIIVSITYIFTMFITYFLIGLGILSALETFAQSSNLALIVSWVIFILVTVLFLFNLYDFFVSRNEEYGKIKNQLPKWVQKMNKRIMKTFTNAMNDEGSKGNLASVIGLTFVLGLTMSLTEFLCTGQIYLGILDGVRYFQETYAYIALLSYNVMFVLPMIIIAVISIRLKGVGTTSNWIRERMHIIKFLNAMLFLGLAIFYAFRLFG
jgi:hypothetical protein